MTQDHHQIPATNTTGHHNYIAHFKDGWPVKDFLQQFLRNHANYRRRIGYNKLTQSSNKITLSKLTQAHISTSHAKLPAPAAHSDSDDSSEMDPRSDKDSDSEEIGPGSEGGLPADIAELFKKQFEDYLKSKGRLTQTSAPTDPNQTARVSKKSTTLKSQTATTSSKKITTAAITQVCSKRAKPPTVMTQQLEKYREHHNCAVNLSSGFMTLKNVTFKILDTEI
ncbi:uncharacterized protein EDB91DRAFT_1084521 [Suillus paluster]|uniref:uncharacterized protein n=1 Tax=Suillus paluster TaxID=48578 RepID=UPI001B85F2D5|nr:uncharacterized protein EDB91DRAFT_1084521 [Suillus paluster]KAG1733248.1 hypothetical protein EDB91DRAFT_1084521 [Suillus paluster]